MPQLYEKVILYIDSRKEAGCDFLFDVTLDSASNWGNEQLRKWFAAKSLYLEADCTHCFRRGCTSVLLALNVSERVIKQHLGWSPNSTMLSVYQRNVEVVEDDRLFYHDLLALQ